MERLCNIFGHPHELIVRRGWRRALCHKVANSLGDIAETGWEHCRGAPNEVFRGERLSPGELRHDICEQEDEVVQALLGRLGS